MPANETSQVSTLSIAARILQVENSIDQRRHLIDHHASAIVQGLRRAITSPVALLSYAGVGVVAGLMIGRKPKVVVVGSASAKAAYQEAAQTDRLTRFIAKALKIVALVKTLSALLPAAPKPPHPAPTTTPPRLQP